MDREVKYRYITEQDYNVVAGPDWPSYDQFQLHYDVPDFVYDEINTMLWNQKPFDDPAFCVLPFYGMEYPAGVACCLMSSHANLAQVKADMLNGRRPRDCQHCWTLEDSGVKSDRLIKNETLDFYAKKDLISLYNEATAGHNKTIHYKIDTNVTCNATCVTCGSGGSSAWAELERKNLGSSVPIVPVTEINNHEADQLVDYASAVAISFRGGEPLLSDTNFYILEKLLEHGNDQCFISFVTNGSIVLPRKYRDLVTKFKNMNFSFSIDGIGPVFEYMRYPLKWPRIQENINFCRDSGILVSSNYTVSNINIMYYEQTTQWFKDNKIPFRIGYVENPHFRPGALPENIKEKIRSINPELSGILRSTNQDEQDFKRMKQVIIQQDHWKKIQIRDFLPEFAQLVNL